MIGHWELILLVLVVLIIFGAGKLPKVMGDMGRGVRQFKSGLSGQDDGAQQKAQAADQLQDKPSTDATAVLSDNANDERSKV